MSENKEMIRETSNKNASSKLVNKLKKVVLKRLFLYFLFFINNLSAKTSSNIFSESSSLISV